MKRTLGVLMLCLLPGRALGDPIQAEPGSAGGTDTQTVTWTDSQGEPRTVYIRTSDHHINRYEYVVDGESVVDEEVQGLGIGVLVNHGDCGASNTLRGQSEYEAGVLLSGPHHYIWQSTFRLAMCDHPDVSWRVTNQYLFVTGDDHFIQTITYDSSDLPDNQRIGDDMRGPYNQTSWPGGGDVTGFGWGSEYKFATQGPIGNGSTDVGGSISATWDWSEPNLIPYVWSWADPEAGGAVDREYGMVQNQPYAEQDFGGGYYGCGSDCFQSAPPLSGEALPAAWALPTQMNSYDSAYRSGRITWGQTYGTFENGHPNDTGSIRDMGDHFRPINAWSITHVVGKYSDGRLMARVRDTENAYASRLTATVGTVPSSGPRGAGDFVGPDVGSMPSYAWSNPGFNFIYRSWNIEAAQGVAEFELEVAGGLESPLFVIHDVGSEAASLSLDGTTLVPEEDYVTSYDSEAGRLWVSLLSELEAGRHAFAVGATQGSATASTSSSGGSGGSSGDGGTNSANSGGASSGGSAGSTSGDVTGGGESSGSQAGSSNTSGGAADVEDAGSACSCRSAPGSSLPRGGLVLLALSVGLGWRQRRRSAKTRLASRRATARR